MLQSLFLFEWNLWNELEKKANFSKERLRSGNQKGDLTLYHQKN